MRRFFCVMLAVLTVVGTWMLWPSQVAEAAERIPYLYSVDQVGSDPDRRISGDKLGVLRGLSVPHGEDLRVTGWLATPHGITGYEYICTPIGGGAATWKKAQASVFARPDLGPANIPYPTGHETGGFDMTIPMKDLDEGYYDVYIRALSADGTPLDFLALLRLRYGSPDVDDGTTRTVSLDRLIREGAAAVRGDAAVSAEGIRLSPGGAVRLGEFYLPALERVTVRYTTAAPVKDGDRRAIFGLKSSGEHPFGALGEACDMTDSIVYAPLAQAPSEGEAEIHLELSALTYSGDLWLTAHAAGEITVTEIVFYYNGKGTDRVAAKLHLSGDTATYLSGQNAVSCQGITDPTVGDCLRIEVLQETNDPFVYFSAGLMMEDEAAIRLDADEYKYMVLLLRADPANLHAHMTLYLCAGAISGATEACTETFLLTRDGQWHYYLLDLTATENWMGIINGWRFDIINGDSLPGNRVDVATVQFFRTAEAAQAVAAEDPNKVTPYTAGEPAVIRDMREETAADGDYTVPPEDTYIETDAPDEPPVEAETGESDTAPPVTGEAVTLPDGEPGTSSTETTAEASTDAETDAPVGGCASALKLCALPVMLTLALVMAVQKESPKTRMNKGRSL